MTLRALHPLLHTLFADHSRSCAPDLLTVGLLICFSSPAFAICIRIRTHTTYVHNHTHASRSIPHATTLHAEAARPMKTTTDGTTTRLSLYCPLLITEFPVV